MDNNPWAVQNIEAFHFYCCPECSEKYSTSTEFQNHAVQNHPKAKFLFEEESKYHLENSEFHSETENDSKKHFKCEECHNFTTNSQKNLDQHIFVRHRKEEHKFKCDNCDKKFPTNFLLKQHNEITHKGLNKRHMCDRCGKAFAYKNGIKEHNCRPGHVQKDVQCDKCDSIFKREMDYLQHHKSQHGGFPAHMEHKVKYLCDQCPAGKIFF